MMLSIVRCVTEQTAVELCEGDSTLIFLLCLNIWEEQKSKRNFNEDHELASRLCLRSDSNQILNLDLDLI